MRLLMIHVAAAGLWLGCVLTEVLFERALLDRGPEARRWLAGLHKRVDTWIEVPAFSVVVITGGLLLPVQGMPGSGLVQAKIAAGLLAVVANGWCVYLVLQRHTHAEAGRWADFERVDRQQHLVGAVVLAGMLVAFGLGITALM
jgi:uncharacterized membrane protein